MPDAVEILTPVRGARGLHYYGVKVPRASDKGKPRVSFFRSGDVGGFYVPGSRPVQDPAPCVPTEERILWLLASSIGNGRLDAVSGIGPDPERRKLWAHFSVGAVGARGASGDQLVALMLAYKPTLLPSLVAAPKPLSRPDVARPIGSAMHLISFPRDASWTANWLGRIFRGYKATELLTVQREHLRLMMRASPFPLTTLGHSSAQRQAILCVLWGAWLTGMTTEICDPTASGLTDLWALAGANNGPDKARDLGALKRLTLGAEVLFGVDLPRGKKET